jgi:hypothetical protein
MLSLFNVRLQSLRLSCSLDKFFCLFLENDAPYSLDYYQHERVRDRDVAITAWVDDAVDDSIYNSAILVSSRILTFTHPIKKAISMGPTEALTTRRQLLRRYQNYGMTVENKTVVEGVPAADTFSIHEFWKIDADGTDSVIVSAKFAPRFTKRTLFKSLIERSILKETKEWFVGYTTMVLEALESNDMDISEPRAMAPNRPDFDAVSGLVLQKGLRTLYPLVILGLVLLLLVLAVLLLQFMYLKDAIFSLREEMSVLQHENMRLLQEVHTGWKCSASESTIEVV